jgi:hypothetical protein
MSFLKNQLYLSDIQDYGKLYLFRQCTTGMADQVFMFAVTTGVFAAFTALLFTARAKRYSEGFRPAATEGIKS